MLEINNVIYLYLFVCICLLLFNLCYILQDKNKRRRRRLRAKEWEYLLQEIWRDMDRTGIVSRRHQTFLLQKLGRIEVLLCYYDAIEPHLGQPTVRAYLDQNRGVFQQLAAEYAKQPAMERAFFAYLISIFHPGRQDESVILPEILLSYLEDSTIYCRENVLKALYAMGNANAVAHAFAWMQEHGYHHPPRLLSDGLATFSGDRAALVSLLWQRSQGWDESFQIAVVQLASQLSASFCETFAQALQDESTPLEVRFALLRYFGRHPYPPILPFLAHCVEADTGEGLAIVAASSLSRYPGQVARRALKQGLHSTDWYVRHNAADSLVSLGVSQADWQEIVASQDRYALDMLRYTLESRKTT